MASGLLTLVAAGGMNHPFCLMLRPTLKPLVFSLAVTVLVGLVTRWVKRPRQHISDRPTVWLMVLWLGTLLVASSQEVHFLWCKYQVLSSISGNGQRLGAHMIVGYTDSRALNMLATRGLIGGVFFSAHNVRGKSQEAVRAQIEALQTLRRQVGLPPLIISTDQEGGMVSRMSPPLPRMPSLADAVVGIPLRDVGMRAFEYGQKQGQELAALGVNVNFAPLADLSLIGESNPLDFRSQISRRAIDANPRRVSAAVIAYAHGLEASGVHATLKHFPGLGRVTADTHVFAATLDARESDLEASDWIPFRQGLHATQSLLMVGHATLSAVDASKPASRSPTVIRKIVRGLWGHEGVLVTDDLTMGAAMQHGVCSAGVDAINAGIDLLLVSYDADQYYPIFHCLLKALQDHTLDRGLLNASQQRLNQLIHSFIRQGKSSQGPPP